MLGGFCTGRKVEVPVEPPRARTELERLIEDRAEARQLARCLRGLVSARMPSREEWLEVVGAVAGLAGTEMTWLPSEDREYLRGSISCSLTDALTRWVPAEAVSDLELEAALLPYLRWLQEQSDAVVVQVCWDLLAFEYACTPQPYPAGRRIVRRLDRAGRLKGAVSWQALECAVVLSKEADAIMTWPDERWWAVNWDRDAQVYGEFMGHASYLVRGAASWALGALFRGCAEAGQLAGAERTAEVMEFVQRHEHRHAGVAGPFLQGMSWGLEYVPARYPEFDFRTWFVETLRASGAEPQLPHMRTLEFYAHEYLYNDAAAIEAMLHIGRYRLAVLTATEAPECIAELRPLLEKMARHKDSEVARAIQEYLRVQTEHGGL